MAPCGGCRFRRSSRTTTASPTFIALQTIGRCQTAADRLLAALPAVQLLLHVPALQRGSARPAVRLGAGRELHARPGLGVPHACPRAPVGEAVVDRGARDWRNGDLA